MLTKRQLNGRRTEVAPFSQQRRLALKVILSENNTYGFNVTRISTDEQLDKLPAILKSRKTEFVVVTTSVDAILPKPSQP
jgi:hypothetical protein